MNKNTHKLCSLSFVTTKNYKANLLALIAYVEVAKKGSIIVAPEVCLSGFDYENWDEILDIASYAIEEIKKVSFDKTVILTMIEKREDKVYNFAKVFHNGEMVYERAKAKLFRFGGEDNYFAEGFDKNIDIIEIDGIKIGILICFELRFKELWQKLEGADVIAVPSWWGALRSEHFKILTNALAVINQCFVIASDSNNDECTKMSGIITPKGEEFRNGNKACLEIEYDKKEISLMRRYMDVGIG